MGVIMQAFYWDCPKLENKEFQWWLLVKDKIKDLRNTGFTALWLPPACKAANLFGNMSMGYDPYDYFDLGDIDQKNSKPTWFGTRNDLEQLINEAHINNMQVYADLVINQTNGGDEQELNPIDNIMRWTKYNPGSKKFARDWTCYHPSYFERMDGGDFGGMPDLCHRNPYVYEQVMEYARWLIEEIGFDGFRYDFVKGYGAWMVTAILERVYKKNDNLFYSPFGVGEYWDGEIPITDWLKQINAVSDNPIHAFDFPLRQRLKNLCDSFSFSLTTLAQSGALITDKLSDWAVTFVENHDLIREDAIVNDKILAYSYILTHEGYPCVFWQDYYNFDLAQQDNQSGIAALIKVHEQFAGGRTDILYCDDDLYIMQRRGTSNQPGIIFVLNNSSQWNGRIVTTQWANKNFTPMAWHGHDNADVPESKTTNSSGEGDFWAPPRGYVVYAPE